MENPPDNCGLCHSPKRSHTTAARLALGLRPTPRTDPRPGPLEPSSSVIARSFAGQNIVNVVQSCSLRDLKGNPHARTRQVAGWRGSIGVRCPGKGSRLPAYRISWPAFTPRSTQAESSSVRSRAPSAAEVDAILRAWTTTRPSPGCALRRAGKRARRSCWALGAARPKPMSPRPVLNINAP